MAREEMEFIDVSEVDADGKGGLEWMICCGADATEAKRLAQRMVAGEKLMRKQAELLSFK